MEVDDVRPGQLVRSTAGRDKGEHYLVLKKLDEKSVLLVNGKNRTIERPKKKNLLHLQKYRVFSLDFIEKLLTGTIRDSSVIHYLKEAVGQTGESGKKEV